MVQQVCKPRRRIGAAAETTFAFGLDLGFLGKAKTKNKTFAASIERLESPEGRSGRVDLHILDEPRRAARKPATPRSQIQNENRPGAGTTRTLRLGTPQ